jgi:hypothetical protein
MREQSKLRELRKFHLEFEIVDSRKQNLVLNARFSCRRTSTLGRRAIDWRFRLCLTWQQEISATNLHH